MALPPQLGYWVDHPPVANPPDDAGQSGPKTSGPQDDRDAGHSCMPLLLPSKRRDYRHLLELKEFPRFADNRNVRFASIGRVSVKGENCQFRKRDRPQILRARIAGSRWWN
jgi:hypothetical protein